MVKKMLLEEDKFMPEIDLHIVLYTIYKKQRKNTKN